jgi:hypothetical protein
VRDVTIAAGCFEHYATRASLAGRLRAVILATSKAVSIDVGLIATFGGIGVLVNVIIVFIAVQIRGERQQNKEYRERVLDA